MCVTRLSLGIYISVPFCRTKCSFCNFASGVFARGALDRYIDQVCREIESCDKFCSALGVRLHREVDSIYLGGGTPSILAGDQLEHLFRAVHENFAVESTSEVTVECAPGTITPAMLDALCRCGVNRVSLGVQSFIDQECSAVGRLHDRATTLKDIAELRSAGIGNIGIDLIAGLPHQTRESWEFTLSETLATGVPHVSVYMLEIDEDSRLGNELLAGGSRYHAHFAPDEDLTADLYLEACERLERGGVHQYEISNFARAVPNGMRLSASRHNLKYWARKPYLGFGVDAHSMLPAEEETASQGVEVIRFATPDSLEGYSEAATQLDPLDGRIQQLRSSRTLIHRETALEESFFLGLRMNSGISLLDIERQFSNNAIRELEPALVELVNEGLLDRGQDRLRLTTSGRLLSNEVFARFIKTELDPPITPKRKIAI